MDNQINESIIIINRNLKIMMLIFKSNQKKKSIKRNQIIIVKVLYNAKMNYFKKYIFLNQNMLKK